MEIVFLLVGLVFAAIGGFILWDERRFRATAGEVHGEVIALERRISRGRKNGPRTFYHPVIKYSFRGESHAFTGRIGSSAITHDIGEGVTVLVQPQHPDKGRLKGKGSMVMGGVFFAIGIGACVLFFNIFEANPFSLAIAAAVVISILVSIVRRMQAAGIGSIEELKEKIAEARQSDGPEGEIIRDTSSLKAERAKSEARARRFAPLIILLGLGMLGGGGWLGMERQAFLERAEATNGTVVDFERHTSTSDGRTTTTYHAVVDFSAPGGERIRFTHESGSSHPSLKRGDAVRVLYDPADPQEAIIDGGWQNWLATIILGGMGLIMLAAGIAMWRRRSEQVRP
jgi:hypothetical protein